jgi:hypothetical protein
LPLNFQSGNSKSFYTNITKKQVGIGALLIAVTFLGYKFYPSLFNNKKDNLKKGNNNYNNSLNQQEQLQVLNQEDRPPLNNNQFQSQQQQLIYINNNNNNQRQQLQVQNHQFDREFEEAQLASIQQRVLDNEKFARQNLQQQKNLISINNNNNNQIQQLQVQNHQFDREFEQALLASIKQIEIDNSKFKLQRLQKQYRQNLISMNNNNNKQIQQKKIIIENQDTSGLIFFSQNIKINNYIENLLTNYFYRNDFCNYENQNQEKININELEKKELLTQTLYEDSYFVYIGIRPLKLKQLLEEIGNPRYNINNCNLKIDKNPDNNLNIATEVYDIKNTEYSFIRIAPESIKEDLRIRCGDYLLYPISDFQQDFLELFFYNPTLNRNIIVCTKNCISYNTEYKKIII